jgi:hypothetical protein
MRIRVRVRVRVSRVTESANALPRYLVTYPRRFRRHSRQTLIILGATVYKVTHKEFDDQKIEYLHSGSARWITFFLWREPFSMFIIRLVKTVLKYHH